jgi:hypothetical protein
VREAALRGSAQRYYALMSPAERQQIDERRQYLVTISKRAWAVA